MSSDKEVYQMVQLLFEECHVTIQMLHFYGNSATENHLWPQRFQLNKH